MLVRWIDSYPHINVPLLLLALSIMPLVGAYISQYVFNMQPCPLCIYQRIPYWIVAGLSVVALIGARFNILPFFLLLASIAFITDAGIAMFHVGVEQHWWEGLEGCGADGIIAQTVEELRAKIMGGPIVRCDEPAFVFLGLSMAAWNVLYALTCETLCLLLLGRYSRGK